MPLKGDKFKMKKQILTWTLAAALLTTPLISGCRVKKEEPKEKVLYGVKTPEWEVEAKEKDGNKSVEGRHKGYKIKIEERKDGSYGVKIKIPEYSTKEEK